jgi:hypothetical protein
MIQGRNMGTHEFSARAVRVAGSAVALAVALSACGGGGNAGVGALGEVANQVPGSFTPTARTAAAASPNNLLSNADFEAGMTDWVSWSNSQVVDGAGASGFGRALRVGTAAGGAAHDVCLEERRQRLCLRGRRRARANGWGCGTGARACARTVTCS